MPPRRCTGWACRSPTAASARYDRLACRTARPTPRIRRTADSSGGRSAADPTATAPPAGRRSRRRGPVGEARGPPDMGLSRSTVASPANLLGCLATHAATSSLETRSRPLGPRHADSNPKSMPAASIEATVASIGTSDPSPASRRPSTAAARPTCRDRETERSDAASRRRRSCQPTVEAGRAPLGAKRTASGCPAFR